MTTLVDVVNFNADASCLASQKWLKCLEGGAQSRMMRLLAHYVSTNRKMNLGLTGATVRDLGSFNREAIQYIQAHPEVFQLLIRPFTHDNPLFRLPAGFRHNLEVGIATLRGHFSNLCDYYLAPEHMMTGEQIQIAAEVGIEGTFIHKHRYDPANRSRIPDTPYYVRGTLHSRLLCVPFPVLELDRLFLDVIHGVATPDEWCDAIQRSPHDPAFFWRDGESALLVPFGDSYECRMLEAERKKGIERIFLSEARERFDVAASHSGHDLAYYPMTSLIPWLRDMKLHWFVLRVRDIERELDCLPPAARRMWLLSINSDILSSAEKVSPEIRVGPEALAVSSDDPVWLGVRSDGRGDRIVLERSERTGEGQDYLAYCESIRDGRMSADAVLEDLRRSPQAHLRKAYARFSDGGAS